MHLYVWQALTWWLLCGRCCPINIKSSMRCCISYVTNYPKCINLKQQAFIISVSVSQDWRRSLAGWFQLKISHKDGNLARGGGQISSGGRGPISKFTHRAAGKPKFLPTWASLQTAWVSPFHGIWLHLDHVIWESKWCMSLLVCSLGHLDNLGPM